MLRTASEWIIILLKATALTKSTKITSCTWRHAKTTTILKRIVGLLNHNENSLYRLHGYFTLNHICSIKTINAISSEHATLCLNHFLLAKPFLHEETESLSNIAYFRHQIIELMKFISMCFAVEIIPNVLHIFSLWHLQQPYQWLS